MPDDRRLAAEVALELVAEVLQPRDIHVGRESHAQHREHGVGAELERPELIELAKLGVAVQHLAHALGDLGASGLADDQLAALHTEEGGLDDEDDTDQHGRHGVERRHLKAVAQRGTQRGDRQPDQRRRILEHGDEDGRIFAGAHDGADRADHPPLASIRAQLAYGDKQRDSFEHSGRADHDVVRPHRGDVARMQERVDPLVDRQSAPAAEHHHGHHGAPEIELHAVAERMLGIGRALASRFAEQHQARVATVDQRVDALGDHHAALREGADDELGHRDGEVRRDCADQCLLGGGRHWSLACNAQTIATDGRLGARHPPVLPGVALRRRPLRRGGHGLGGERRIMSASLAMVGRTCHATARLCSSCRAGQPGGGVPGTREQLLSGADQPLTMRLIAGRALRVPEEGSNVEHHGAGEIDNASADVGLINPIVSA